MTLTQMEYIVAVDRERNFRKAAESCFVTQPTLSHQVAKLEEELGVVIFDRSKKPVVPTALGAELVEKCRKVLDEAKGLQEIVEGQSTIIQGVLKIGVIPTIAPYLVPCLISGVYERYPDLRLEVSELTTENCLKSLDEESIDLAILATKEDSSRYFQDELYEEPMMFFGHLKHRLMKYKKISVEQLESKDIWLLEEGHCLRDEIVSACKFRKDLSPKNFQLKVGNLETLRNLVRDNFGYTILPYLSTLKFSKAEKEYLKEFKGKVPSRIVSITRKRRNLKTKSVAAIREEILRGLPRGVMKLG